MYACATDTDGRRTMERRTQAVVFDFDRTLTKRHLYHLMHGGHPVHSVWDRLRYPHLERAHLLQDKAFLEEDVFGGRERVAALRSFLGELREQGVTLYISSLNFLEPIRLALAQVGLLDYFDYINAKHAVGLVPVSVEEDMRAKRVTPLLGSPYQKEYYLSEIVTPRHSCTVFIDDELRHKIRQAQLFTAHNLKQLDVADPEGGVDERDYERIRALLAQCPAQLRCCVCQAGAVYYSVRCDQVVCARGECREKLQ